MHATARAVAALVAIALGVLTAGCAPEATDDVPPSSPPESAADERTSSPATGSPSVAAPVPDGVWQLVGGSGPAGPVDEADEGRVVARTVDLPDGEVSVAGPSGESLIRADMVVDSVCWAFAGEIGDAGSVGIGWAPLLYRRGICEFPEDADPPLPAALDDVSRLEVEGERLLLHGPTTELRFEAVPRLDVAALRGTIWAPVGTWRDGAVDPYPDESPAASARFLLTDDGTLVTWDGCTVGRAAVVPAGDRLQIAVDDELEPLEPTATTGPLDELTPLEGCPDPAGPSDDGRPLAGLLGGQIVLLEDGLLVAGWDAMATSA